MEEKKYHVVTLRPTNDDDKKTFWKFSSDDILLAFSLYLIFHSVYWLPSLLAYIADPSHVNLINFGLHTIYCIGWLFVWLISRMCKSKLVYMLPILFIISNGLNICIANNLTHMLHHNIGTEEPSQVYTYVTLMYGLMLTNGELLSFTVLLSPS